MPNLVAALKELRKEKADLEGLVLIRLSSPFSVSIPPVRNARARVKSFALELVPKMTGLTQMTPVIGLPAPTVTDQVMS